MPRSLIAKRSALSCTLGCLILAALLAVAVAATASAAPTGTQTVTTTADAGPGSLRQAIVDAAPGDTIDFALSYPATITLTSGQLSITKPLTITGPGPDLLAVSGNHASRVFQVDAPGGSGQISVTIAGLTIRDGYLFEDDGGGLWNDEDLALEAIVLAGNAVQSESRGASGGGVFSRGGRLKLIGVVFASNQALGFAPSGGGMYITSGNPVLTGVTFSGNSARWGGALDVSYASPKLNNVVFSGNSAELGGGGMATSDGNPSLVNVTFSGNTARHGGAIYVNRSTPTIHNSILWGNRAASGGDQIYNHSYMPSVSHSIVEGSGGSGAGWDGNLGLDEGGNLDADPRFVQPPNGGLVPGNLRLQWDSPAINAGRNRFLPPGVLADLAGEPRVVCDTVDMGAYEYQSMLCLRKQASRTLIVPGEPFTYTLVAWNTFSNTTMTAAMISDSLPAGVEFAGPIELDPPGAGLAGTAPPILVSDLTLAPGQAVTVTFPVTATSGAPLGNLVNTAAITSSEVPTLHFASHTLLVCETHLTVASPADGGSGSLRQAIANVCPDGSIDFALTTPATITLTRGQLAIRKSLTITGPGPDLLAVSGHNAGRVFRVDTPDASSPISVNISGLTIRDGSLIDESGAGLWNEAHLELSGVTFRDNWAYRFGGGLYNKGGSVRLSDVAFYDTSSGQWGGAMYNANASATLSDVIFARNSSKWSDGGGLYNSYSTVTLTHALFEGNSAGGYGGGLYNRGSSPVLAEVTFRGNSAAYGGGIAWPSGHVMTDMVFEGNSATEDGGGIYGGANLLKAVFRDNSAGWRGGGLSGGGTLAQVLFEGNSAGSGGGGMDASGTSTLTHVTFRGNSALLGGGMATGGATLDQVTFEGNRAEFRGGGLDSLGSSILKDVTFRGNLGGDGGGMFSAGSSTLTNVVFQNNQARSPSSVASFGGGMHIMFGSPSLANVVFSNNLADYGGGMANQADYGPGTPPSENISPTLTNVTLAGNVARIVGGGIFNRDSDPRIHNSILWANEAISGSQIYNDISTPTLAYCDIQDSGGSGPGWDGGLGTDLGNNLDADPGFRRPVDPAAAPTTDGDLRLRWGSPAIDAGHNDLLPPGVTTDLDGNPRIVNDTVDLGAYESQSRFAIYLPVLFRNWPP